MKRARTLSLAVIMAVAGAAVGITPVPVTAADCGADYIACLGGVTAAGSSDPLHERACWAAYWECLAQRMLLY